MGDIALEIDGKVLKAKEGMTVLEVVQDAGIHIPTLCYHEALEPFGACRLCTVEIMSRGRSRLLTACTYPAEDGLVVKTDSPKVMKTRKMVIELMLTRCPNVKIIQNLAREYGIEKPRFKKLKDEDCILCGLCSRICQERMGVSAISFVGRGIYREVNTPFDKPSDACLTCGACAFVCPTGAIKLEDISKNKPIPIRSEFDMGLRSRSPIYVPYPQGVPNVPAIDRDNCVHYLTGACKICEDVCKAVAIKYDQEDEVIELDAGAIILAPGYELFNPKIKEELGYGRFPNVITSLEFERVLSASGPFSGEILRPYDKKKPEKIAFIQCVGSRGEPTQNSYCSSVCCTYAIKEAIVAKEHSRLPLDTAIFFMDMRTFGKGFEAYYERAMSEHGVRFIRCRPSVIEEIPETKNLRIKYEAEDGKLIKEEFDLVVLAVGLEPPKVAEELANRLGIELNKYGFCKTDRFLPVETSKPGIFVCGTFQGPKDIPETVMQASAAAASASASLSSARNSLVKKREYPPEKDIRGEPPRIGVFVCHCGINIAGVVNVPEVKEYAASLPNVVHAEANLYTCSQDTQEQIKEAIKEHNLNRVVVVSCTPRTHEPLFQETIRQAGLNRYLLEMANIRDQCSWVHKEYPDEATEKAKELVKMAVAKARLIQPVAQTLLEVIHSGLVIGGGIAGMIAALNLTEQGFEVYLVEKGEHLGGIARRIRHTLEGDDIQTYLQNLITQVSENPLIQVYTNADIVEATGYVGNFTTRIEVGANRDSYELKHGVVIIATGGEEYKPSEYLYGEDARVMTLLKLEDEIAKGNGRIADCDNAVIIQCVGSRETNRPYCSRVCCSESIKCALKLKEAKPGMNIYVIYRDVRTYGFKEDYYREAREKGVIFIRYEADNKPRVETITEDHQNRLRVTVKDLILGEDLLIDTDILGLAVAAIPAADNKKLSQLFKVPLNEDGFLLEAHMKLRPVEFATEGVFMCGLAHNPKFIEETIAQAKAAASRAGTILSKDVIEVGGLVSLVDESKCSGCGVCALVCPFQAVEIDAEKKVAKVNEALCKGCGACVSSCICGAMNMKGFSNAQILAMLK